MSTSFVAIYRGKDVQSARLIGLSADPGLVADVSAWILAEDSPSPDPIIEHIDAGRRRALRLVCKEARHGK